jgi:NAD(P)-dependent dehydrogenase (short-subunit alcohol dehydrogenase family)
MGKKGDIMDQLAGKVGFITGGGSGIGLGIAKACCGAGMKLVVADINQSHLDAAKAVLSGDGAAIHVIRLDVTDRAAMAAAADETERVFGKVHLLVNNAGIGIGGPLKLAKYDDWDWGLEVNLGGVVNGIQSFLPRLLAHGEGGHIVNTASMAGILPVSRAGIYIAAKAAVIGISEVLRGELAENGIGVSAFCPGPVQTNIAQTGRLRPERYQQNSGYVEFERRLGERPNSPLWMTPEEVGMRVLEGIRRNDLFILTHPEFKDGVRERCDAILASFPDEPINEARAEAISFLTRNPIYARRAND